MDNSLVQQLQEQLTLKEQENQQLQAQLQHLRQWMNSLQQRARANDPHALLVARELYVGNVPEGTTEVRRLNKRCRARHALTPAAGGHVTLCLGSAAVVERLLCILGSTLVAWTSHAALLVERPLPPRGHVGGWVGGWCMRPTVKQQQSHRRLTSPILL